MTNWTRRKYLKSTAAGLAASAAPAILSRAAAGSPNETANHAVVGLGNQGSSHAQRFSKTKNCRLVAICDVDPKRLDKAAKGVAEPAQPKKYADFRELLDDKDIDTISIASCDHWHTPIALAAILAGKHVYVEKPAGHTVHEANLLLKASKEHNKCVQHGTQLRSHAGHMALVKALREGIIGNVYTAKTINHQRRRKIGRAEPTSPPPGVNYDLWQGSAPEHPFTTNRWHYKWHWFWDYGGGDLVNDGIHHLDLAIWGLGKDKQYPVEIVTSGAQLWYDDDHETPDTQNVVYIYPDVHIIYEMRLWTPYGLEGYGNHTVFYGTEGHVTGKTAFRDGGREKIEIRPEDYGIESKGIVENFIDAARHDDPSMLKAPIEIGAVTSNLCNLGNIGVRLGNAKLVYDGQSQKITHSSADLQKANAMLTKEYRKPYTLPYTG
jgi:predicted dehydrogenase